MVVLSQPTETYPRNDPTMSPRLLRRTAGALVLSLLLFTGVTASASALLTQTIAHKVYTKLEKRSPSASDWNDDGVGGTGTWIGLYSCHFNDSWQGNPEPQLELLRHRPFLPDASGGLRTYTPCTTYSSQNWGMQVAGKYHFDVVKIDVVLPNVDTVHITKTVITYK